MRYVLHMSINIQVDIECMNLSSDIPNKIKMARHTQVYALNNYCWIRRVIVSVVCNLFKNSLSLF